MFVNNKVLTLKTIRKHGPVNSRVYTFKRINKARFFSSRSVKFKKFQGCVDKDKFRPYFSFIYLSLEIKK